MRYWWMRDRAGRNQFRYYWGSGKSNRGDYYTKHFCAAHHRETRPKIFTNPEIVTILRAEQGDQSHQIQGYLKGVLNC